MLLCEQSTGSLPRPSSVPSRYGTTRTPRAWTSSKTLPASTAWWRSSGTSSTSSVMPSVGSTSSWVSEWPHQSCPPVTLVAPKATAVHFALCVALRQCKECVPPLVPLSLSLLRLHKKVKLKKKRKKKLYNFAKKFSLAITPCKMQSPKEVINSKLSLSFRYVQRNWQISLQTIIYSSVWKAFTHGCGFLILLLTFLMFVLMWFFYIYIIFHSSPLIFILPHFHDNV